MDFHHKYFTGVGYVDFGVGIDCSGDYFDMDYVGDCFKLGQYNV